MAMYVDLYDSRNYYIGEDGEYQKWNIDPKTIEETADVVEIVRCKDCKYYRPAERLGRKLPPDCRYFSVGKFLDTDLSPDDFCSRGERMADNG